jgi:hypothetical protein
MRRSMTKHETSSSSRANFRLIADDCHTASERQDLTDDSTEVLMPLEAAAKAILVKANGLPAYRKATGRNPKRNDT